MKKKVKRINESQLKAIVAESVKKVLKEYDADDPEGFVDGSYWDGESDGGNEKWDNSKVDVQNDPDWQELFSAKKDWSLLASCLDRKHPNFIWACNIINDRIAPRNESDWIGIDEVCAKFRLAKNNIKSRKWRLDNGFPCHQDGAYSKVTFNVQEVEEFLRQKNVSGKAK